MVVEKGNMKPNTEMRGAGRDAMNRFGQMFSISSQATEEMTKRTSDNFDAIIRCGTVLADGYQSMMREWMNCAQEVTQRNLDGFNALLKAQSIQDLMTLQSDLLRKDMEVLLNGSARISELSGRAAVDAVKQITDSPERQRAA